MIKKKQMKKGKLLASQLVSESEKDQFEELKQYLDQPWLKQKDCPNPIPWWGVGNIYLTIIVPHALFQMNFESPVLHLMAHDYLAIPATTCIAERSFSLSAHTDDP